MSLKRDYLRHEKEVRSVSRSRPRSFDDGPPTSSSAPSSLGKDLPRYMRGTTSVSKKYSVTAASEHQVIRDITRAASPSKQYLTTSKRVPKSSSSLDPLGQSPYEHVTRTAETSPEAGILPQRLRCHTFTAIIFFD